MIIDIERWNEQSITEKRSTILKENGDRIIYHDQDALNAVLYGNWEQLGTTLEHADISLSLNVILHLMKHTKNCIRKAMLPQLSSTFTGHDKPWNTLKDHPYTTIYLKISA